MAYLFTESHLKTFLPNALQAAAWTVALTAAMERFEINSSARIAAFLAQIAHESGELRRVVENLNYSARGLTRVWPRRTIINGGRVGLPDRRKYWDRARLAVVEGAPV